MKRLLKHLLNGEISEAREEASTFPPNYGNKLIDDNGSLSKLGLSESIEYPFPEKLNSSLIKYLNKEIPSDMIYSEYKIYYDLFNLVNKKTNKLSEFGVIKAICAMELEDQCSFLNINYETVQIPSKKQKPEPLVIKHYSDKGFHCRSLEGGEIFVLLRCASWELLSKANTFKTPYLEAMLIDDGPLNIHKKAASALLEGISKSSQRSVQKNFKKVYNSALKELFPGLDSEYISNLYEMVGLESLYQIAKLFIESPYTYRKGWPDIISFKNHVNLFGSQNRQFLLREIKVNDKLLTSQVVTISKIKEIFSDIGVIKLEFNLS
jgi:hypothetical protein